MGYAKYKKWLQPNSLIRVKGWAMDGLSLQQIAENIGIDVSTLSKWRRKYDQFDQALNESKDVADRNVENALYKQALAGNTTAIIFWLKNRKRLQWRERPIEEIAEMHILKELAESIRSIK